MSHPRAIKMTVTQGYVLRDLRMRLEKAVLAGKIVGEQEEVEELRRWLGINELEGIDKDIANVFMFYIAKAANLKWAAAHQSYDGYVANRFCNCG